MFKTIQEIDDKCKSADFADCLPYLRQISNMRSISNSYSMDIMDIPYFTQLDYYAPEDPILFEDYVYSEYDTVPISYLDVSTPLSLDSSYDCRISELRY